MSIPWKQTKPNLKNNRQVVKRLQECSLRQIMHRMAKVHRIFEGYLAKGYICKLDGWETLETDCCYLPFFFVINKENDTTPVRIVWDCQAAHNGRSLNSEIELTPNRLQDLFKVLLRPRKYPFAVTSDVSEMFLKIQMDPKDQQYHCFVLDGEDNEWCVVLFGNIASPNGSQKVLTMACKMFGQAYPKAVETLQEACYMDNTVDSWPTEKGAWDLTQQLFLLLGSCSMPIHKFYTNSMEVIGNIDPNFWPNRFDLMERMSTLSLERFWE